MIDFTALDNPIWSALISEHRALARTNGLAARYPNDVSPLAGLAEPTPAAFMDLSSLVARDERVALFTTHEIDVPGDWRVDRTRWIDQMVCMQSIVKPTTPILTLSHADIKEMLALTAITEPGPFLQNTISMGRYFGIRSPERKLLSMAGERLKLRAFTEISAVCTDPNSRGQGHSRTLLAFLIAQILSENKTPFLHVKTENAAKILYEKVGFKVRCPIRLTVISHA